MPLVRISGNDNNILDMELGGFKKRKGMHASFMYLKKELKLEGFKRKTQIDSLLKKCKSKAFRTIHEALKNCLSVKLARLPQAFITNIKIDFNKNCLEKTILEIYKENKIIPSYEDYQEKGFIIDEKKDVFKNFLSLTFKNVFDSYVTSKQYIKDYHHIKQREGEEFAILFNFISKIFVQYYTKSKGNKHKGRKMRLEKHVEKKTQGLVSGLAKGLKQVVEENPLIFEIKKIPKDKSTVTTS
jgi:hypothetical protein